MNMAKIKIPLNARHLEHNEGQDRCIARKGGVPKKSNDGVAIHSGMTSLQKGGAGIGGMGHPVAGVGISGGEAIATSAAASPLAHAYSSLPKRLTRVAPAWGSKTGDGDPCPDLHELGAAVLAEAGVVHRGKGSK
jgi:hypothetical protein